MQAAVVRSFDAPPRYDTFADAVAAEGEKLVHVTAAALHLIVKSLVNGTHYGSTGQLPFIPGVDGVGRLEDGTRVYFGIARPPFGTFSELALASGRMCLPLPEGLDDVTAAAIANPAMSSWVALTARAKCVGGESVLILGATGVAGQLAVQIAKRFGAHRVIAASRNPEALEKLNNLGADAVILLEQDDPLISAFRAEYTGAGVDIILDYLWGKPAEAALEAISQKGLSHAASRIRFVQIGSSTGKDISLSAATLRSSGLELIGSGFGSASFDQIRQAIAEFFLEAAKAHFQFHTQTAPLHAVEALWSKAEQGARSVFQP
jgi:NADPH:quinone reductase-like Zn-dependent oxidoreductase